MTLVKLAPTKLSDQPMHDQGYVLPDVSANATQQEIPRALLKLLRTVTVATTFSTIGSVGISRVAVAVYVPDYCAVTGGGDLFRTSRVRQEPDVEQKLAKPESRPFLSRPAFGASDDDLELESPISGYRVLPREERRKIALRRRGYNVK